MSIDTDNDGVLESMPWTSVIAAVALIDGDANPDFDYDWTPLVGPDGNLTPAHAYQTENCGGTWAIGVVDDLSFDTPGVSNVPEPGSAILILLSGIGLPFARRK